MTLFFVGLGLGPAEYLTKAAEKTLSMSDMVYVDSYTSPVSRELLEYVEQLAYGRVVVVGRDVLEDKAGQLVERAAREKVCVAVPGDPFIATTHAAILEEALKRGVETRVVFGVSAYTAAISMSGLHVYKFGRSATIPKTEDVKLVKQAYYTILENQSRGLHTLLFLDTREGGLTASEGLSLLLQAEREDGRRVISEDSLVIALARVGYEDASIAAGPLAEVVKASLPPPPHTLIIPGELHFTERELLERIASGGDTVKRHRPANYVRDRVMRYVEKCRRVLDEVRRQGVERGFCGYVEAYVEDSRIFLDRGDYVNALLAIGYAEGLLDALRLLGMVRFEW